jgi:hypothetical protein
MLGKRGGGGARARAGPFTLPLTDTQDHPQRSHTPPCTHLHILGFSFMPSVWVTEVEAVLAERTYSRRYVWST